MAKLNVKSKSRCMWDVALGFEVAGLDEQHSKLDTEFQAMIKKVAQEFPTLAVIGVRCATTTGSSTRRGCAKIWRFTIALEAATTLTPD
jgi:hypothetical protein